MLAILSSKKYTFGLFSNNGLTVFQGDKHKIHVTETKLFGPLLSTLKL